MATKNLFLQTPSAGDIQDIYSEGAESISRLSLPSFPSQPTPPATQPQQGFTPEFEAAVTQVLKHEGGFTASDGNTGAPANFGINQAHNPDVDVRNITQNDAKAIYKTRYWDAIGGDNLPAELQGTAFDAAVNQGPANARKWLQESGGDVNKFNQLRRQHYEALAAKPEFARYRNTWMNRLASYERNSVPSQLGLGDPKEVQARLDAEEPGRYKVLTPEEARRFELQSQLDAEEPGRYKVLTDDDLKKLSPDSIGQMFENKETDAALGETGFWERLPQVAKNGWENMSRSLDVSRAVLSDDFTPKTVNLIADSIAQQIKQAKTDKDRQHSSEREVKDAIEKFGKSEGFLNSTGEFFSMLGTAFANPKGVAIGSIEQLSNMLPSMGGALAGAGAGAGIGAGVGSVVPGAGTAAGAAVGAVWGSRAGLATGTAALEYGNEITEAITSRLEKQKKEPTRENIAALLSDPAMQEEIKSQAATKGLTLAAVDALTMGMAGKVGSKALKQTTKGKKAAYGAGAFGIELAGEPVGEAASQLAARGEIDKGDVAGELIFGAGTAAGSAAIGTGTQYARNRFAGGIGQQPGNQPPAQEPPAAAQPPAQPAPQPEPSGPITRAMQKATGGQPEQAAQPTGEEVVSTAPGMEVRYPAQGNEQRVRVVAENGDAIEGTAQQPGPDGMPRVLGDDGQIYVIGPDSGATIEPVAAPVQVEAIPQEAVNDERANSDALQNTNDAQRSDQNIAALGVGEQVGGAVPQTPVLEQAAEQPGAIDNRAIDGADATDSGIAANEQPALTGNPLQDNPASWVIRDKETGAVVGETFDRAKVDALNTDKYEAVPAYQHLAELNDSNSKARKVAEGQPAQPQEQAPIVRTDGTPFKSEAAARQAMKNRRLQGYQPVQVGEGWGLSPSADQPAPKAKPSATSAVREMTEEGRAKDGGPIMPGDKFRTLSGRETAPYPKQKGEKYASQWLVDNATAEAESRGDNFNARTFRSTSIQKGGGLTAADRESMLMYLFGEQPQVVPSILKPLVREDQPADQTTVKSEGQDNTVVADGTQADNQQPVKKGSGKPARKSNNKVFTDEAAEKARALLRSKLSQLNSGIDPEVLQAGITLAGWHIENGARTFAAYAKAMINDMGEGVKPYLKSWYLGVKFDPRSVGMEGMSTAAEVEQANVDSLTDDGADTSETDTVVTPNGIELEIRYRVVEGSDLITSNFDDGRENPDYPKELQPRERGRAASQGQIREIVAKFDPRRLGSNATTTDGAPIVSRDGVVESGNGRTIAIRRIYSQGLPAANAYRKWLTDQGYDISGMTEPILVRERVTEMSNQELQDYTSDSNESTTLAMSPTERAMSDAKKMAEIIGLYRGGDVTSAANRDFVRSFMGKVVSQTARGTMMDSDGILSQDGRRRIEAALMAAAYGNPDIVTDLFESSDTDIKAIGGALMDVAGVWAQMRDEAASGAISTSVDVTPNLMEAVAVVRRARGEGRPVAEFVKQDDFFAGSMDQTTVDFLNVFYRGDSFTRARGRDKVAEMLSNYVQQARATQPGNNLFGEPEITGADIIRNQNERTRQQEGQTQEQSDLISGAGANDALAGETGGVGQRSRAEATNEAAPEDGGQVNVPSTRTGMERDSDNTNATQSIVPDVDGNAGETDAQGAERSGAGFGARQGAGQRNNRVSGNGPATGGERSNQPVHRPDGQFRPESSATGSAERAGSRGDSVEGSAIEQERTDAVIEDAQAPGADDLAERLAAQKKADGVKTKWGDKASIDAALPLLLPEQRDDVLKAETRLANNNGILFTNGTGTGKTATGLGVIKRHINDGKDNIIVVVPSDKIASDWVKFAGMMGVDLKQLEDTASNGKTGPIVTTYANFGQNETLAQRDWDLVVADESHYLSSNESGDKTAALEQLRALTGHHNGFYSWVRQRYAKEWKAYSDAMKARSLANGNLDIPMEQYAALERAEDKAREKWMPIEERERAKWGSRWSKQENLPKAVFLSATPFAYAKNTDYAEGYLFHYVEPSQLKGSEGRGGGYNSGSARDRFMMTNFGYRMRYNKLTAPEAGVDSQLMEQQFNEMLKQTGALSGRRLEVPFDYDRKFVLVDDAVGQKIDEGLKYLLEADDGKYRPVYDAVMAQFDYQRRMYLLESMKARAAVPIIRDHLSKGRKVVVFHDFNKGGGFNPFEDAIKEIGDPDVRAMAREVLRKPMFKLDFTGLKSPIETMLGAFPDALFFNGTVPKAKRRENADLFNDDNSGRNLIVVQSDAGREGVSLHDTTGKFRRVEVNLGMPVKPVAATQIEGRIYRTGQASDASFRYLTTGTSWEASAFARKIAERASTAENLALGNEARGLKEAFIEAYQNAGDFPASDEDGKGGKDYDRQLSASLTKSPFERAKSFYWGQQKNTKRRDQREGVDYFATPEPVGYKMVEWADIKKGDKVLEPSAGHGAIARFVPELADLTMVEPSYDLSQRAALANGNARIVNGSFENLHITNKFDAIVMNPPYGSGGKTSTEHLAKAAKHLRNGGRIVALLPRGGQADKRLDAFLESEEAADLYTVARVDMPSVTFERAGTSVNTQIIVLEKHANPEDASGINQRNIDLSSADSINDLFDRIENVGFSQRRETSAPEPKQELVEHTTAKGKVLRGIIRTDLTKEEAQEIDRFTFRKKNAQGQIGWFIRAKHLEDGPKFSVAYHGSPHRFDRFTTEAIGTGEGAQAYGWGLYFAGKKEIAEYYRKELSKDYIPTFYKDGKEVSLGDAMEAYYTIGKIYGGYGDRKVVLDFDNNDQYGWSVKVQNVDADGNPLYRSAPRWHSTMPEMQDIERDLVEKGYEVKTGQLYEVDIPEDVEMLLWDAPFSEQPAIVKEALADDVPNYRPTSPDEMSDEQIIEAILNADPDAEPDGLSRDELIELAENVEAFEYAKKNNENPKGLTIYQILSRSLGGDKEASDYLRERGIKGIKYLDGTSRYRGGVDGSYNYVIFDENDVAIQQTFYSFMQERDSAAQPMSEKQLRGSLTSGVVGPVVDQLIESGVVTLHKSVDTLPEGTGKVRGIQALTMPDGSIHMVADSLTPQNARAVLFHEMFHKGGERAIGSEQWSKLMNSLGSLYRQAERSTGKAREFFDRARIRTQEAKNQGAVSDRMENEEFGAYAIEEYETKRETMPAAIRKWASDFIGFIKAWTLRKYGKQLGRVTPAQLSAIAKMALLDVAADRRGQMFGPIGTLFSASSPVNSPAFRRWFGDSKVVDADGKPMVMYHGTGADVTQFNRMTWGSADPELASQYSEMRGEWYGGQANVMPIYMAINRPFDADGLDTPASFEYPDGLSVKRFIDQIIEQSGASDSEQRQLRALERDIRAAARREESGPSYSPQDFWHNTLMMFGQDGASKIRRAFEIVGFDGVRLTEQGALTYGAFRPEQIKSATGNIGTFDPENPDIRYSVKPSEHFDDLSKEQKSFLDKIGPQSLPQRLSDRWRQLTDNLGLRIRQAGVDRYAALLRNDKALYGEDTLEGSIASSSWVLARMSASAGGALTAMLNHGRIYLDPKEKVIDVREGTAGLRDVFQQVGTPQEIDRFMAWIAANRSRKLLEEGRENLFTADEVEAGIKLSTGKMQDGRNRAIVYAKAWKDFQQFRNDVLAISEQAGTISPEQRQLWSEEFYVPFYRVLEDENISGPSSSSGLSRQQAYKKLKGGKSNLNDLLENTLMNYHHLLQVALKNQAAKQAIDNAIELGIAEPTTESARDKKASTFIMVDGNKQWYNINDPLTFKALSALNSTGLNSPVMKAGRAFKRLFTNLTTVTPQFVIANTLRDSLSAMATSPTSAVPFSNAVKGAVVYGNKDNRAKMLASGASFSFGHVYGQGADEIKASLKGTMREGRLLKDPSLIPGVLTNAWRKWNNVTDFAENVNRAGIWERNLSKGKLKAAFEARDLMDFSAHGDALTVRIMIDLIPFLNARIQGQDKLYRSGLKPGAKTLVGKGTKADKKAFGRFAAVVGALSVMSMMLYLSNWDDEEYRKLEDWQRDTYWFFRIGEDAFFIPKPFEVGAMATLAERALEQFTDPAVAGKKFGQRLGHMLTDTFSLDLPQIIKPLYELSANRNTFTGRPIEDLRMDRVNPSLRVRPDTTRLAEGTSRAMEAVIGDAALSPVQIDHLVGAYLGQVGAGTMALADTFWRRANGEQLPARDWKEYQPIKRFYRDLGVPAPYTRYATDFYEAAKEADKAYASVMRLEELQEFKRADELAKKEATKLDMYRPLNRIKRQLSELNSEMRQIQMDKEMDGQEKRARLDRLRDIRNTITMQVGKELEQERIRARDAQQERRP